MSVSAWSSARVIDFVGPQLRRHAEPRTIAVYAMKLLSYSAAVFCIGIALQSGIARHPAMRDIIQAMDPNCQRTVVWEKGGRDTDFPHT